MDKEENYIEYAPAKSKVFKDLWLKILGVIVIILLVTITIITYSKTNNNIDAIQHLLTDIAKKQSDPVVVYKDPPVTPPVQDSVTVPLPKIEEKEVSDASNATAALVPANKTIALLLALNELQDAINKGVSFNIILTKMNNLCDDETIKQKLNELHKFSYGDLPTNISLYARIDDIASDINMAQEINVNEPSMTDKIQNLMEKLIVIKKVDLLAKQQFDVKIKQTKQFLYKEDYANALSLMSDIKPNNSQIQDWITDAKKLKTVKENIANIYMLLAQGQDIHD
jgi:hypothetical protein